MRNYKLGENQNHIKKKILKKFGKLDYGLYIK